MQHQPPAVHNDYLMGASWSSRLRNTLTTKWLYVLVKTKKKSRTKNILHLKITFILQVLNLTKVASRIRIHAEYKINTYPYQKAY